MLGAFGHSVVHLFTTVPFLRAVVTPLLPKPGDGPPEAFRERNHWKFTLHGWTDEDGKARPRTCQAGPLSVAPHLFPVAHAPSFPLSLRHVAVH
jgi:hypothetical protein